MKKKLYLFAFTFLLSASLFAGGVFNGSFETNGGSENCTGTNFSITKAVAWDGIRIFYTSGNCATPSFATGTASGADLYSAGLTDACVPAGARTGNKAAHLELRGFYPNQTASAEWARQSLTGTFTAGRTYTLTAYLFVTGGPLVVAPGNNYFEIGFRMVHSSVGTDAAAIINNAKGQASQPATVTNDAGGWVKLTRSWVCPTTGQYKLLIGPWAIVFCNDGNYSWLGQYNIDDVDVACSTVANAGPDRANFCRPCCNPGISAANIGTAAVSGYSYSWSPTTALSNASIAQPTASPCGTTTYTLTVTSNNNECSASTDAVTVVTDMSTACCRMSGEGDIKPPFEFNVYPNPSKNGNITIDIPIAYRQLNIIVVSGPGGTVIYSRQFKELKQSEQLKLTLPPKTSQKEERVLTVTDPATGKKFSVQLL